MIEKLKKYIKSRGFQKACTVMVILFLIYDFGHIFWESETNASVLAACTRVSRNIFLL